MAISILEAMAAALPLVQADLVALAILAASLGSVLFLASVALVAAEAVLVAEAVVVDVLALEAALAVQA